MTTITQKDLRDLCHVNHNLAEKTVIAQQMINGTISITTYKNLCYQLYLIADFLETASIPNWDLTSYDINRRHAFVQDISMCLSGDVKMCDATKDYINSLRNLQSVEQLKGHIYVHYLGWLYGGQMIAKKLRYLPVNHLQFVDVKAAMVYVRENILTNLTNFDANEANSAFSHIIKIYEELAA